MTMTMTVHPITFLSSIRERRSEMGGPFQKLPPFTDTKKGSGERHEVTALQGFDRTGGACDVDFCEF